MSAGDFFNRWSRRKSEAPAQPAAPAAPAHAPDAVPAAELPPPTLEDVAALGYDADFRRFVQPGVDESVRRSAMKKLFTDPQFNVMDGLDIYIGDYNTFEPMSAAMVAALLHGKALLDPLGHLQQPAMRMLDRLTAEAENAAAEAPAEAAAEAPAETTAAADTAAPAPAAAEDTGAEQAPDTPQDPAPPQDDHTIQSL
ncbi:MAG: DUF3306 domain-containing protein [Noviherbaspirillum sp.]